MILIFGSVPDFLISNLPCSFISLVAFLSDAEGVQKEKLKVVKRNNYGVTITLPEGMQPIDQKRIDSLNQMASRLRTKVKTHIDSEWHYNGSYPVIRLAEMLGRMPENMLVGMASLMGKKKNREEIKKDTKKLFDDAGGFPIDLLEIGKPVYDQKNNVKLRYKN